MKEHLRFARTHTNSDEIQPEFWRIPLPPVLSRKILKGFPARRQYVNGGQSQVTRTADMPTRTLAPVLHYLRKIETEAREHHDTDGDLLMRFVRAGDQTAIATLLKRHGPMVFGVCRRVLRNRHEAEDAFQATFLLLLRKAASLRQPELVGNWLHGVAYRTALRAKSRAGRHAAGDRLVGDVAAPPSDDVIWRDMRPLLDRAIDDLPTKYRTPFVLCYLQGLTNGQAARHLGCPEGTVATRLSRARQRLRTRLAKHGLGVAAGAAALGAPAAGLSTAPLSAAPPPLLIVSTLRIATVYRLGTAAAVPATVAALTEGVDKAMFMTKLRFMLAAALVICTGISGTALWALGAGGSEPAAQAPQPVQTPPPLVAPQPMPPTAPAPALKEQTPAVVRTENFIVRAPSRRLAQLVGDAAERLRKSEALRWLGKELPGWPELCTLTVTLRASGMGHATTFQFDNAKVVRREMQIDGTLEQVLCNGLPHEITHAILADYFRAPVPRWADEGAAQHAEDGEEQQRHQAHVHEFMGKRDRLIPLKRLLPMRDYPQDVTALYVEGYSLTHFLLQRKDRKTFLAFVKQGMNGDDWDAAAKDHYALDNVHNLQQAWLEKAVADALAQRADADSVSKKASVLTSAPPLIGRASVDKHGKVILRMPVSHYVAVTRYVKDVSEKFVVPVTSYELKITEQVSHHKPKEVTATDVDGKPIDAKTLAKRLQTETAVLIAPAGQAVDPYYLTIVREGSIILTLRRADLSVPPAPVAQPPTEPALTEPPIPR
jgi:RNA polymerase sigma factor (sigma-70 family)